MSVVLKLGEGASITCAIFMSVLLIAENTNDLHVLAIKVKEPSGKKQG